MLNQRLAFIWILTTAVIFSSFYIFSIEAINCFQCNSLTEPECETLKANDTHSYLYRPCEQQAYTVKEVFCRKIVQVIADRDNLVRVVRRCSWERHSRLPCYHVSNADHVEVVCQCFTDGCNSATNQGESLIIASSFVIFAIYFI
ncbi:uncharacterized protein LOC142318146 [Lycorma delicatula]|uniref:uncharacterized protein LOC142318146 n=1 Tax=Lycorma delicatula TaxID=130591 RepID=UPI003F515104